MNKKLIISLILSFLSLQTFSFLHNAEFGFEEHSHVHELEHEDEHQDEHDNDVCEIYLYCEQTKDNNYKSVKLSQGFEHFIIAFALHRNFVFYSQKYKLVSTRAPPQFS